MKAAAVQRRAARPIRSAAAQALRTREPLKNRRLAFWDAADNCAAEMSPWIELGDATLVNVAFESSLLTADSGRSMVTYHLVRYESLKRKTMTEIGTPSGL